MAQPLAIDPVVETPAGGAISAEERELWCQRAARACTEGRLTLGAYSDLVEVLEGTAEREAFDGAAAQVRGAGVSMAIAPVPSGAPIVAVFSGHRRRGSIHLAQTTPAVAVMGSVDLDIREATISGGVTVIQGMAVMGGIEIRVPPGIRVEAQCLPILGGCDVKLRGRPPRRDAPVIRLQLALVMAGVNVRDGGGIEDLLEQGASLAAAGFRDTGLQAQQSRIGARAAARSVHREAHEARREARRAAHRARRARHP